MRRSRLGAVLVAVGMVMLTACSGSTDPATTSGTAPAAAADAATAAETATEAAADAVGEATSDLASEVTGEAADDGAEAPEGEPLRIVFLTNASGTFSAISADGAQGVETTVEQINAAGGVLGRPLEVETIDTESDPTRATTVAEGIEQADDLIGVVGPEGTATCFAARAVLVEKGIPHYCSTGAPIPGGADGLIPGEFSPYYFATSSPPTEAGGNVPFAWFEDQGYETMALITSSDASGQLYSQIVEGAAEEAEVEIVAREQFDATAPDVTPQMTTIRAADPDVIYIGTTGAGLATVLQSSRDLGIDAAMWAGWGNAAASVAGLIAGLLPEGGLVTYGEPIHVIDELPEDHPQADVLAEASARWQEENSSELPVDVAIMHDVITTFVAAAEGAGSTDADAMVQWLEEDAEELVGLAGIYDFTADDHRGTQSSGLVIRFTEEGGFALEGTVDGG